MDLLAFPLMVGALLLPAAFMLRREPPLVALAVGAALGVLGWGTVALLRFFLLLPAGLPRSVGVAVLAAAVALGALLWVVTRYRDASPNDAVPPSIWAVSIGGALITLGFEASLPHFGAIQWSFDWWLHFDLTRFYLAPADLWRVYPGGDVVTSRTPLYNLLGALALEIFGNRFSMLQLLTAALGWLWLLPAALLAQRLTRVPATMLSLLALSPLVRFSNVYTWPKGLVAFLLLLALERVLALRTARPDRAGRTAVEAGLASGGALLAHVGFAGFLLPLFLLTGYEAWRQRKLSRLAYLLAATGVVIVPWFAWGIAEYGWHRALLGYYQGQQVAFNPIAYGLQRLVMLASGAIPVTPPLLGVTQNYFLVYVGSAAGVAGLIFLIWALAQNVWRRAPGRAGWKIGLAFASGGILVATLLSRQYTVDSAATLFVPAIVVLALLAVGARTIPRLVIVAAVLESGLFTAILLIWMWSAASGNQPNAELATINHVRFLGTSTLPFGLVLMVIGTLSCFPALGLLHGQVATAADRLRERFAS